VKKKKKEKDGMELVEKKNFDTKYTDFARNEVYSFLRLTATLSTVIIGFTFSVLALQKSGLYSNCFFKSLFGKSLFIGIVSFGSVNIFLVWLWIKRSIYKFYNLYDNPPIGKMALINRIKANAQTWERWIWTTFMACFTAFLGFLIIRIFV
jgi:hypothetical protein